MRKPSKKMDLTFLIFENWLRERKTVVTIEMIIPTIRINIYSQFNGGKA